MANVEVLVKEVRRIRLFGKDIVVEEVQTKPPEVQTKPPEVEKKREEVEFLSIKKPIETKKSISKFLAGKKVRLSALSSTEAPNYPPILSGSQPSQPRLLPWPAAAAAQNHCRRRKRKVTVCRPPRAQPAIPPQLSSQAHAAFKILGGTGLVYLANKTIEVSDVNDGQNRLFIPKEGLNSLLRALTVQEKDVLEIRGDKVGKTKKIDEGRHTNKIEGKIEVTVIDGEGNSHGMNFKKWPSMGKLVLLHGWYQFVKAYELKAGDSVQLWCFRGAGSRLCFAIVKNEIKGDARVYNGASSSSTSALSNARN